jgi:hypothetical protein
MTNMTGPEGVHQVSLTGDAKARHDITAELPHPSPTQAQAQAQHPVQASHHPLGE